MKVKEYLSRYHYMELKIKHMQEEIKEYTRLANSIPGVSFDAIKVDGTKSFDAPYEKWIYKTIERERQLKEMIKTLPLVKCEIMEVIDELEDSDLKRILIYRYIDWLSWSKIATNMIYSSATIRRWHAKVLSQITITEKRQG